LTSLKELKIEASSLMPPSTIAAVQCKLLLGLFAVFSGDMTERALSKLGYWTTVIQQLDIFGIISKLITT
jgi:hypothetical protein